MGAGPQGLDCEDFQRVIYSDEFSVEQVPAGHQRWVFRMPQEKWHKDCALPKNRRQVKLMVWGCFWGSQRGALVPLIPANGSITAYFYRSLLRHWLLPVLEDIRASLGGDPLFQQDNARIGWGPDYDRLGRYWCQGKGHIYRQLLQLL